MHGDRKCLHLSSPGWQAIGLIYNDFVHELHAPDPIATARSLASIDWARSGKLWESLVVEKKLPNRKQLGLDKLLTSHVAKAA